MTGPAVCRVVWTVPSPATPDEVGLLDPVERRRMDSFRLPGNRTRFVRAAVLLRRLAAAESGVAAERVPVDRTCRRCGDPHGRPGLTGLGLHASVTHSGDRVGVALTAVGPVGLDVERVAERDTARLAGRVLGAAEHAAGPAEFYRYWTRKESVVKATGDGILVGLRRVRVSPPDQPPRLLSYPGAGPLAASMCDLAPGGGYAAAVTVLGADACPVEERWCGAGAGSGPLARDRVSPGRP